MSELENDFDDRCLDIESAVSSVRSDIDRVSSNISKILEGQSDLELVPALEDILFEGQRTLDRSRWELSDMEYTHGMKNEDLEEELHSTEKYLEAVEITVTHLG